MVLPVASPRQGADHVVWALDDTERDDDETNGNTNTALLTCRTWGSHTGTQALLVRGLAPPRCWPHIPSHSQEAHSSYQRSLPCRAQQPPVSCETFIRSAAIPGIWSQNSVPCVRTTDMDHQRDCKILHVSSHSHVWRCADQKMDDCLFPLGASLMVTFSAGHE